MYQKERETRTQTILSVSKAYLSGSYVDASSQLDVGQVVSWVRDSQLTLTGALGSLGGRPHVQGWCGWTAAPQYIARARSHLLAQLHGFVP